MAFPDEKTRNQSALDPEAHPEFSDIEEYLSNWSLPLLDNEQHAVASKDDENYVTSQNKDDGGEFPDSLADHYLPLDNDLWQQLWNSEIAFGDEQLVPDASHYDQISTLDRFRTSSAGHSEQDLAFNQQASASSCPATAGFDNKEGDPKSVSSAPNDMYISQQYANFRLPLHLSEQSRTRGTLPRRRSRYALHRTTTSTTAAPIPIEVPASRSLSDLSNPLQRWRNSPPEEEPASMTAISRALSDLEGAATNQTWSCSPTHNRNERLRDRRKYRRPRSVTSSQGSRGSSSSRQSGTSNQSIQSLPVERVSSNIPYSAREKLRTGQKEAKEELRIFKCTFCCDSFKRKYDWTRHEKSLHLDLEGWKCAPFGGIVASQGTSRTLCAYCNVLDPTTEHLEMHNHHACHGEGTAPRTFGRKDHLVQHLRLVHRLETLPLIDNWKVELPIVHSRCGFCDLKMNSWEERQDHLAFHFRNGATMDSWIGEHEFDAVIQAQVKNAIPPYLLAGEIKSLVPFSVTNIDALDCMEQIISGFEIADATLQGNHQYITETTTRNTVPDSISNDKRVYTELLTSYLAKFAQDQVRRGIIPTDEMFQNESRKVMYLSEDPWNQTAADNPRWLADFRQRHNLNNDGNS